MSAGAGALDLPRCEALVARACAGHDGAWRELAEHLWPFWQHAVRTSRAMGSLAQSDDHVHNVVATLVEKIGPEGGTALGLYPAWRATNPGKTFEDWMRIVTAYTVRDYVRHTHGRRPARDPDVPSPKRLLNEFAASPLAHDLGPEVLPTYTLAQTARQMLEWAEQRLTGDQLRALLLWMEGADFDEIGAELAGGGLAEGRKLVRAAVAVLRRPFAGEGG